MTLQYLCICPKSTQCAQLFQKKKSLLMKGVDSEQVVSDETS